MENRMSIFLGEHHLTLAKGSRIILPKKHRENIRGGEVILTKGFEGCIFVFGKDDWISLVQSRIEKRRGDANLEEFERYIFPSAVEISIDAQRRIVVPTDLLAYAGVKRDISVIGVGDRMEIWDKKTWEEYKGRITEKWRTNA